MLMIPCLETTPSSSTPSCRGSRTSLWSQRQVPLTATEPFGLNSALVANHTTHWRVNCVKILVPFITGVIKGDRWEQGCWTRKLSFSSVPLAQVTFDKSDTFSHFGNCGMNSPDLLKQLLPAFSYSTL